MAEDLAEEVQRLGAALVVTPGTERVVGLEVQRLLVATVDHRGDQRVSDL
jgi:hypothetical protein